MEQPPSRFASSHAPCAGSAVVRDAASAVSPPPTIRGVFISAGVAMDRSGICQIVDTISWRIVPSSSSFKPHFPLPFPIPPRDIICYWNNMRNSLLYYDIPRHVTGQPIAMRMGADDHRIAFVSRTARNGHGTSAVSTSSSLTRPSHRAP